MKKVLWFLVFPLFLCSISWANEQNFSFSKNDRIIVVAPHPDDEALGCAGVIQSAIKTGADVKVVYLTHGESNELSALFYQKKPMLVKEDFVKVGRLRKSESIEAMKILGVPEKNLIFFGYPDMGTMPIWERFWSNAKPFRSFFTRINKVIHGDDYSYGKYYRGYNIMHDFEKVLLDERPTHIFVTAPFDLNLDHQAAYLFLTASLLNVGEELSPVPSVHLYLIHEHDWPKPKKYAPMDSLRAPEVEMAGGVAWKNYPLDLKQVNKKEESLLSYESQLSYSKNFLLSFVRKNEIFADYPYEKLQTQRGLPGGGWMGLAGQVNGVSYTANDKELFIEIPLIYALDEIGTFSTNVFGFKEGVPFAEMPKLKFRLFGGTLFVKDGLRSVYNPGIDFKIEKSRLFIRIPLKSLKDPDILFVSTRTAKNRMAFDFGSWRVIRIKK